MALKRVWIPSPNYSSRGGAGVRLIVLHTAEGARTIESLGGFFQGNVGASSHVGADDKDNTIGEYVSRGNKAWTAAEFNPVAVQIELCGFASWSTNEWKNNHHNMLENCAKWIAEEAAHYGIPITRLNDSQAQGGGRGVCQHVNLGSRGGGHWDCGSGFPMDYVLDLARGGAGESKPPPERKDKTMVACATASNGNMHVFAAKGKTVKYTWQWTSQDKSGWNGGEEGKQIAGMQRFCDDLPADIIGIDANLNGNDSLHVFIRCENGKVYYTYQPKGKSEWANHKDGGPPAGVKQFADPF